MASGIYAIVNKANHKQYVGSAVDLDARKKTHFTKLRNNVHSSRHLQAAWNKYGEAAFVFRTIEELDNPSRETLLAREQHWMDTLFPAYNKRLVADCNLGVAKTPAERKQISEFVTAWRSTPEGQAHSAKLAARAKAAWADPVQRDARIAALKAAWTPEKRLAASEDNKATQRHILVDGEHFGTRRVWTEEEKLRSGAKLKEAWKSRAPVSEDDIRAMVSAANPAWKAVELTGVRSLDKVLIHCEIHDHAQWQTVAKVRHAQRGCKLCGYQRSSDVQVGRPKKSSETPERNLNHG